MKKIISLFLTICMIISICAFMPLTVSAATSGTCGDNLTWTLDDEGTLTISGKGEMRFCNWGDSSYYIKTVIIEDGVTNIASRAFEDCENLTNITIPDSVTNIGVEAFICCESLTSITIPDNVTSIGLAMFKNCFSLTNITIPDSVTYIGRSAFNNCYNLRSITIPSSVTSIGDWAFSS